MTAAISSKNVAARFSELDECVQAIGEHEIHESLWDQSQRVYLQVVALGREMKFGYSLETIGLCATLLHATIADAVAVTHELLLHLDNDEIVALTRKLDEASDRTLAHLQSVVEEMGIESRNL